MATKKTSTSTRKTTGNKASPGKSRSSSAAPGSAKSTAADPAVQGVTLDDAAAGANPDAQAAASVTKKALFERVKAHTEGVKGRDVRLVIDAVLTELGAALAEGETLKLPPLGTMKVQRKRESAGSDMVVCKLRRKKPKPEPKDPLAEAAE